MTPSDKPQHPELEKGEPINGCVPTQSAGDASDSLRREGTWHNWLWAAVRFQSRNPDARSDITIEAMMLGKNP